LSGENILTSSYGSQEKNVSSLYEYIVALILLSYMYSKKKGIQVNFIILFILLYVIKDLLFGGRIASLAMILLAYIIFYDRKFKFKFIIFYGTIFFIFLKVFEFLRLYNGMLTGAESIDLSSLYSFTSNINVYSSNEGNVVYSSIRLVGLVNENIITSFDRINSFLLFIISAINPGIKLPPISDLSSYLQNIYPCGGGGLFPVYFFIWGGLLGVIFSGFLIAKKTQPNSSSRLASPSSSLSCGHLK
jgi:hypothetical protein